MVNIMATEKNTPVGKDSGVVTHKVIVETKFGTFAISLFSNNPVHQAVARNRGKERFSEKFIAQIKGIEIVDADAEKPSVDVDGYFD